MYSQRTLRKLVEGVYDAAANPQLFLSFLELFKRSLNSEAATFFVQDLRSQDINTVASVGIDPSYVRSYEEHYATKNVYLISGNQLLSTGKVWPSEMLCPDRDALRSDFYNEWIAPQRLRHGLLGVLVRERSMTSMIGAIRRPNGHTFDKDDRSLILHLMPHLQRAIQLHRRIASLDTVEKALGDALNRWSLGVILLDHQGQVLLMNRSAEAMVRRKDGLSLEDMKLRAGLPSETVALRALIHGAIRFGSNMVLGFNQSSTTIDVQIAMVSKFGAAPQSSPVLVKTSPGPNVDGYCFSSGRGACRWGDYSSTSPDPTPGTTHAGRVWLTNEWNVASTDDNNVDWRTWNWTAAPHAPGSKE